METCRATLHLFASGGVVSLAGCSGTDDGADTSPPLSGSTLATAQITGEYGR